MPGVCWLEVAKKAVVFDETTGQIIMDLSLYVRQVFGVDDWFQPHENLRCQADIPRSHKRRFVLTPYFWNNIFSGMPTFKLRITHEIYCKKVLGLSSYTQSRMCLINFAEIFRKCDEKIRICLLRFILTRPAAHCHHCWNGHKFDALQQNSSTAFYVHALNSDFQSLCTSKVHLIITESSGGKVT